MVIPLLFRQENAVVEADTADRSEEEQQPEEALFCAACSHLITYENQAVEMHGSHHHTFFNPAGIVYEIRCFSKAQGCLHHGESSAEFTWFAGYTWCLAMCAGCQTHLGWFFSSGEASFYGLIGRKLAG